MGVIKWLLDAGPTVFLPLLLFIFGLALRIKPGKAFKSALMVGIGFTGLNLVIKLLIFFLKSTTRYNFLL